MSFEMIAKLRELEARVAALEQKAEMLKRPVLSLPQKPEPRKAS